MKFSVKHNADTTHVRIAGKINEHAAKHLTQLGSQIKGKKVVFDVGGIDEINSAGVRDWVVIMHKPLSGLDVTFENASSYFVDYVNVIPDILMKGRISSFQIPFLCNSCDHEEGKMYESKNVTSERDVTSPVCPDCKKPMEPSVDLDSFLGFLRPPVSKQRRHA